MSDLQVIVRLRVTPAGGTAPIAQTYTLKQRQEAFHVSIVERDGVTRRQTRRRVPVSAAEAREHLTKLQGLTIPAFLISLPVCDGEHVKLTIEGQSSSLTVSWWTIAPDGAEGIAEFANWLRGAGQELDATQKEEDV